jgi:hypothetical protein
MILLISHNPVKTAARVFLRPLFFFTFACYFLPQGPVKAADAPGSAELPLTYVGPKVTSTNSPDGNLIFSPDVQSMEIYRSNRKPSDFFGGRGYTYAHHMDLAAWKGRLYAAWDVTLKDEDVLPAVSFILPAKTVFIGRNPKTFSLRDMAIT